LEEEKGKAEEAKDKETIKEAMEGHNFRNPLQSLPTIPLFFFSLHRNMNNKKGKRNGNKLPLSCGKGASTKITKKWIEKALI
jgi:hypothetical protein